MSVIPDSFPDLPKALCEIISDQQNSLDQQLGLFICICSLYRDPIHLPIESYIYI